METATGPNSTQKISPERGPSPLPPDEKNAKIFHASPAHNPARRYKRIISLRNPSPPALPALGRAIQTESDPAAISACKFRQPSRTHRLIRFLTTAFPHAFGTTMAMRRSLRDPWRQLSLSCVPLSIPPSRRMARKSGRRRRIRARGRRRSRPGVAGVVALHPFGQKATATSRPATRDQSSPSLSFHARPEAKLAFPSALGGVVRWFHFGFGISRKSCRGIALESTRSSQNFEKFIDFPLHIDHVG